ncbi:hypothetical protein [Legionella jamestowniensis]|uniref:Uncharacterized protein n=1 Tax=Legionella jamestowniensis TaxID=455 RepID=A0A0W0UK37_9GAMM|nr:hypothetical protein [Legionella jamestowniensis]KTD08143.1 hypothetical protein Ljam_2338 [Legionella jamestowniensis]SFL99356.1 hypothetical protein SAMN02746073_2958 [Legionella jamestowniensis DSM 19215]
MKTKIEREEKSLFEDVPNEVINIIVDALNKEPEAQRNLNLSCRFFYNNYHQQWLMLHLIDACICGNQEKAQKILQRYPELMIEKKDKITDLSGRTFYNLSVWQYILWALDVRYMAPMMLHCLPHTEEGEAMRLQLAKQLDEVETHGVIYELNGNTFNEKHYDFAIISVLSAYYNECYSLSDTPISTRIKSISDAQQLVPAHVAQHYCDTNVPFTPTPTFKKEQFTRSLNCYLGANSLGNWFACLKSLGHSYAISKAWSTQATLRLDFPSEIAMVDWVALFTLKKARNADLAFLKQQLQKPLQECVKGDFSATI